MGVGIQGLTVSDTVSPSGVVDGLVGPGYSGCAGKNTRCGQYRDDRGHAGLVTNPVLAHVWTPAVLLPALAAVKAA